MTPSRILAWLRGNIPESARGRIHQVTPALFALLVSLGVMTDVKAAAWSGLALVVAELALATLHATTTARTFAYPLIAAVASVAVAHGVLADSTASLAVGLAASMLGAGTAGLNIRPPAFAK